MLEITGTSITTIPEWIGGLKHLEWLVLDHNEINVIPAAFLQLQRLAVLRLGANHLDTVPERIVTLPKLQGLDIGDNPIRHLGITDGLSASLQWINIAGTRISNTEYKEIHRQAGPKVNISHDKEMYFEDEDKPCYTDHSKR